MQLNYFDVDLLEFKPIDGHNTEFAQVNFTFYNVGKTLLTQMRCLAIYKPLGANTYSCLVGLIEDNNLAPSEFLDFYGLKEFKEKLNRENLLTFNTKDELQDFLNRCVDSHNRITSQRQVKASVRDFDFNNDFKDHPHFDFFFLTAKHLAELVVFWRHKETGALLVSFDSSNSGIDLDTREVLRSLGLERVLRPNDKPYVCGPYSPEVMDQILEVCLIEEQARETANQTKLRKLGLNIGLA